MKNARIQCKDIPDNVFLFEILRGQMRRWIDWYGPDERSHQLELPWCLVWDLDFPDWIPYKVILRKADKLIKQGRMDGCTCGCRGDFEVRETQPWWHGERNPLFR